MPLDVGSTVSISNIRTVRMRNRETLDATVFAVVFAFSRIRKKPANGRKFCADFAPLFYLALYTEFDSD